MSNDQRLTEDDRDKGNGEAAEERPQPGSASPAGILAELSKAKEEAAANRDRWLRAAAEAENTRRRCEREKSEYLKYATERMVRDLLPVVDNLERALEHAGGTDSSTGLLQGVELTLKDLTAALERQGVVPIEALGKSFDPNLHEAVSVEERRAAGDNEVVGQLQRGYLLKDRLLRPALVVVAKTTGRPPGESLEEETTTEEN
ncbi:MAG: nucleotide exchange factor GrpE [Pseudomonadota bacterium]